MPKVSVYLSDELYRRAKEHSLPISTIAQEAIEMALRSKATDRWVAAMRARPPWAARDIDTAAVMERVKDEWGS